MKTLCIICQGLLYFGYAFFSEAMGFGINDNFYAWFIGLMGLSMFGFLNYIEGQCDK